MAPRLAVDNTIVKVLSTAKIDGGAYRLIGLPDGSGAITRLQMNATAGLRVKIDHASIGSLRIKTHETRQSVFGSDRGAN
jgi:hypothetical protein